MERRELRVLVLAGLATFFVSFDSAVLILALPAVANDFRTSLGALTQLGSVLATGTLVGLPLAMLADRLGRRRLLVIAVAGFSLANLASAGAPALAWLAAARVVAVCFETVAAGVATALVVEEVAPSRRGLAVAAITVTAGAGTGATTLLYPLVAPAWRSLYLAGGAGLAAAALLAWRLRESEAWLASRAEDGGRPRVMSLRLLLARPWGRRLLLVSATAAMGAFFYQPAGLLFALFGSRELGLGPPAISAVIAAAGLASVPAFLAGGRLSDRYGRRALGVAITALAAVLASLTFTGDRVAYWAGNILWSFFASASVPVLGTWYAELFPTRARATSESAAAVAGALGGVAGFQAVGVLQLRWGLGPSLVMAALAPFLAAALLLLLPETRGEPLPP